MRFLSPRGSELGLRPHPLDGGDSPGLPGMQATPVDVWTRQCPQKLAFWCVSLSSRAVFGLAPNSPLRPSSRYVHLAEPGSDRWPISISPVETLRHPLVWMLPLSILWTRQRPLWPRWPLWTDVLRRYPSLERQPLSLRLLHRSFRCLDFPSRDPASSSGLDATPAVTLDSTAPPTSIRRLLDRHSRCRGNELVYNPGKASCQ